MVYILGGAQTDFERNWTKEGKSFIALLKEVVKDGLDNAGISYEEIIQLNRNNRIACFIGNFIGENFIDQGHFGGFLTEVNEAFYGVPSARYEAACASGSVALDAAITKIQANEYDLALVIGFELMKTVDTDTCGNILGRAAYYEKECKGIELPFPMLFGKLTDSILDKYPELDEKRLMDALATISVINYENAKRNPKAQTRKWYFSLEKAINRGSDTNPYVGGKLAVSDCSQVTDGAAMVLICSENYIRDHQLKKDVVVKGYGHRVSPIRFDKKMEDNIGSAYILPWTRQAVLDAYRRSGLTVEEIDVFETHDCFTPNEYIAISAFGLTEPGKEYEAVESGLIAFNGRKPINPSGGLIGCGHPVGASGVRMFLDIYKQVSGTAGGYQVKNVRNALMLNIGGSDTTNYVFIIGKTI